MKVPMSALGQKQPPALFIALVRLVPEADMVAVVGKAMIASLETIFGLGNKYA